MDDLNLVSKIKHFKAIGKEHWPSSRKFLRDLVKRHIDDMSSFAFAEYRAEHGTEEGYEPPLAVDVWYCKAGTFREECERLGRAEFLRQKGMARVLGTNSLEESIELLDEAVTDAMNTDAARFMMGNKEREGYDGVLYMHPNWVRKLLRLGAAEFQEDGVVFEGRDSIHPPSLFFIRPTILLYEALDKLNLLWTAVDQCISKAAKYAKKNGHDLITAYDEEVIPAKGDRKRLRITFSFYKVNGWIYTYA